MGWWGPWGSGIYGWWGLGVLGYRVMVGPRGGGGQ